MLMGHTEGVLLTKLQEWGNGLGLRIPKALAEEAGVSTGSEVDLSLEDGRLIVTPVRRVEFDLERLLAKVSDVNLHSEVDTGDPVGREA
jgi:antitoxin MazE